MGRVQIKERVADPSFLKDSPLEFHLSWQKKKQCYGQNLNKRLFLYSSGCAHKDSPLGFHLNWQKKRQCYGQNLNNRLILFSSGCANLLDLL